MISKRKPRFVMTGKPDEYLDRLTGRYHYGSFSAVLKGFYLPQRKRP